VVRFLLGSVSVTAGARSSPDDIKDGISAAASVFHAFPLTATQNHIKLRRSRTINMDRLFLPMVLVHQSVEWVTFEPLDWQAIVLATSWTFYLLSTYLACARPCLCATAYSQVSTDSGSTKPVKIRRCRRYFTSE
jgi:hypothetical protein